MNANSTSTSAKPQGSKTFDTNRENIFTQVILSEAEHAALVAVAEAAESFRNHIRGGELDNALANLATVRGESEGGK